MTPNGKPGSILCEFFKGNEGTGIGDLLKVPAFPNKPDESILLTSFEIPADTDDNYGSVVRGFIVPPTTGNYTFWIASDDASELWLSPSEDPKDKLKLCQVNGWSPPRNWDASPEQKSKPVPLKAGQKYYIEALHKEGTGGDNLAVGWQLADGTFERPIPGKRLIPAGIPKPPPPTVVQIQGQLPRTPGFHKCMAKVSGPGGDFNFPFLLTIPNNFGKAPVPSLLFLHGVGECGTDLEGVYGNGPAGHLRGNKELREFMPMLLISPQCAIGWGWTQRKIVKATVGLLDEIQKAYGPLMDKDRVTMTGLSMGGAGTWHVAMEAPEKFAALTPCDPRAVRPEEAAEKLKNIAVWIIAGGNDGDFTRGAQEMYDALKNSTPKPEIKLLPDCGHGAWSFYYPKRQFYEWLLKWKRTPNGVVSIAPAAVKPAEPPAKPVEKPKEPVAVVKPPEKAPPPPAVVKVPEPPAKPVEVAVVKPAPKPPELPKPPETAKPKAPEVVAVHSVPPPAIVEPKKVEPLKVEPLKIEPKKIEPAPVVVKAPPVEKIEEKILTIGPAKRDTPKKIAAAVQFPYAQTSLFCAALFMLLALYFLLLTDAKHPAGASVGKSR